MIEIALVIFAALIIDIALGEPPRRVHPTAWMGALVGRLVVAAKGRTRYERTSGTIITLAVVAAFCAPIVALYSVSISLEPQIHAVIVAASGIVVLYVAVSVRSMLQHVAAVTAPLELDDIAVAQQRLAAVVKRKTGELDGNHILSGLVETIAENTVDGIISPLSYFALAGAPGAIAYRAVNTIDAMIGYKTPEFRDIGWFGATCDRVLNYIPARITAVLMVASAAILRLDWRAARTIAARDHAKTSSPNAGYPIAAMAGALGVRLEKIDHYVIGQGGAEPTTQSVKDACKMMLVCTGLYGGIIATLVTVVGILWWRPFV